MMNELDVADVQSSEEGWPTVGVCAVPVVQSGTQFVDGHFAVPQHGKRER